LNVEEEIDHVAVFDDIGLAFASERTALLRFGEAAGIDQVLVADDLSTDEPALDVRVDRTGGLDRLRPPPNRPCPALVWTDGEERHEPEQVERNANDAVAARFFDSEVLHEDRGVLRVELA